MKLIVDGALDEAFPNVVINILNNLRSFHVANVAT